MPATGEIVVPVKNPTATAAKRALSTSFGSIAFGSLILAAIDTLRFGEDEEREEEVGTAW